MPNPLTALMHQLATGDFVLALALALLAFRFALVPIRLWRRAHRVRLQAVANFSAEIGLLLLLEQAYEFTRGQIPHKTDVALMNAYRLLDFEWRHGFFVESRVERYFLQFSTVMNGIDAFYILGHVTMTIGVLTWLYFWHRNHYGFIRNLLMVTTALALVVFYVYPTAPPRMLGNYGFVDPLELHHLVGPGGAEPGSYTFNPYAAMPSLHVAYALIAGWGLFLGAQRRLTRIAALCYPLAMSAAVVISANHWIMDVLGAYITVAVAATLIAAVSALSVRLASHYAPPSGWRHARPQNEGVTL